jgi:uncharacterized membrane protein
MKNLCLLAVFVFGLNTSYAQLNFRNNSSSPVIVAHAMENNSKRNEAWYSEGWMSCDPNQTIQLSSAVGLNPNVYFFAKSKDGKKLWNGVNRDNSVEFLVSSDAFVIKNANMAYVAEENPSYSWKLFRHVKIPIYKIKYTITIN